MKTHHLIGTIAVIAMITIAAGCSQKGNKKTDDMKKDYSKGTFGYDVEFFKKNKIDIIELKDSLTGAAVLVVPGYQGRVMTSTSGGDDGMSFGWINYSYIESGKLSSQFNPFGGEERFWLGPEGGPFSIYFRKGDEQAFTNWKVPAALDTEPFNTISKSGISASFEKQFSLVNASGTKLEIGVKRGVRLLNKSEAETALGLDLNDSLSLVAYTTENTLTNNGTNSWDRNSGFLSIWLLGMFNPSEKGVVFIPYKPNPAGNSITDNYFGKVPADRLIVKDSILFFKTDGKYRSKIGISPESALPFCGSYDPVKKNLTILWLSLPETKMAYVNSVWGKQADPLKGDAVNSYNDGPVEDGSIMGPFYEIESSSPAALLKPGESMSHTQRIFHISGDEKMLNEITEKLFKVSIEEIKTAFR